MARAVAQTQANTGPDEDWLRARLAELAAIERPSASEGEREAAEWIVTRLAELGAEARIEAERAHGTYWWPLGIAAAVSAGAGLAALRGHRLAATALGAAAAAALADEYPPGGRRLRNRLPAIAHPQRHLRARRRRRRAHDRRRRPPRRRPLGLGLSPGDPGDDLPPPRRPDRALRHQPGADVAARRLAAARDRLGAHRPPHARRGSAPCSAPATPRRWRRSARAAWCPGANDNGTAVVLLLALARSLLAEPTDLEPA